MLGYLFVDCSAVVLDCTVFKVFVLFCMSLVLTVRTQ